jgi:hypothetical protein
MIRQEAALPMSCYIVPEVNTRCVPYPQVVSYAGLELRSQVPHMALYSYVSTELPIGTFIHLCYSASEHDVTNHRHQSRRAFVHKLETGTAI